MDLIKYIAVKEDGKPLRVVNSKLLREATNKLPRGRYDLTIRKHQKQKSNPQLGYLFSVVYPLSIELLTGAGWEITTVEQADAFWKDMFAKKDIVNRHTGEIRSIPALKRDFLTIDMMTYINSIRDYCGEYLDGYIPEPNEQTNINFE